MKTTIIYTAALFTLGAFAEAHRGGPQGHDWQGQHEGGVQDNGKPHGQHDARDMPQAHGHFDGKPEHGRPHPFTQQDENDHERRGTEGHGRGHGGQGGRGGRGRGRGGRGGFGGKSGGHSKPGQEGQKPGGQPQEGQQPGQDGQQPQPGQDGQQPQPGDAGQSTTMATSTSASADGASATPAAGSESS